MNNFNLISILRNIDSEYISLYEDEIIPIPKLNTRNQRLLVLKHFCLSLGLEAFDYELALNSFYKNRHLFSYRCSGIWALWLYCNYIPRTYIDKEFIWIHYIYNSLKHINNPEESLVWFESCVSSDRFIYPLPPDFQSFIDIGLIYQDFIYGPDISPQLKWAISDIPDFISSLKHKKVVKYITEGIASTWDRKPRSIQSKFR